MAAAEVHALALAGPLTTDPIDRVPADRSHVLPVASFGDLPDAQERLRVMLRHTLSLRPEHANQIVMGQARNATAIAVLLRRAADPREQVAAVADGLAALAAPLLAAGNRPRRTASIYPGDPRPLYQTGEMTRFLTRPDRGRAVMARDVDALVSYAAGLRPVVRALTSLAGSETLRGRWLVPGRGDVATWTRFLPGSGEPPLLTGLRDVIPLADRVSDAATSCQRPQRPVALGMPPRQALAAALAYAQRTRPPLPGNRPKLFTVGTNEPTRTL